MTSIVVHLQALLDDFDYSDDDEETVDRKLPSQGEGLQLQPPDLQQQQDSNPSARYRGEGGGERGEGILIRVLHSSFKSTW